jgi:hypothetical protein
MNGRPWREEWANNVGIVAVVAAVLVLVVMAVFLYLVSLSRGQLVAYPAERMPATQTAATEAPAAGGAESPAVAGVAVLPSPVGQDPPVRYLDARHGFEMQVPAGWRQAKVSDAERPPLAADYDVVWEDPSSHARLAASVWDAVPETSFMLWSALVGTGMSSVDGMTPYNAVVAGQPALLLGAPESPTTPARLAVFFGREGKHYRLAYTAHDGGAAISDYARALASLHWPSDPPATLVLPLRALASGRFWPSDQLFGPVGQD